MLKVRSKLLFLLVAVLVAWPWGGARPTGAHGAWPWVVPHMTATINGDTITYVTMLENRNSHAVHELEIFVKVPHGTTYVESWAGHDDTNRGVFTGSEVKWFNSQIAGNAQLGPFVLVVKVNPARGEHPHQTLTTKAYVRWNKSVAGDALDDLTMANPLQATSLKLEMSSPGHWHVTRAKKLTFSVKTETGQTVAGLKPQLIVKNLGGKADWLAAKDNGDGTYSADYTAREIGAGYETGYSLVLAVEQGGNRHFEAWPVEVVRDGNEGIMPIVGGTKYAYQVRYGWDPGLIKTGDEVNLIFEPRRAIETGDKLNTQQPFRNTLNHVPDLENVKVLVESDGQLVEELVPSFSGLGLYTAKRKFDMPGSYSVSLLFTDPFNGFTIDKSETSYPLTVSAAAPPAASPAAWGLKIALTPPGHWHATRAKKLTFTVMDAATGQPVAGLRPEVTVRTLSGSSDKLTAADNGDGSYTAEYTAREIGPAYSTFYTIGFAVEKDGTQHFDAWPVEVVRDGNEGIMPMMAGSKYAYQVRYGWSPGIAKVGSEVTMYFEPRRALQTGDKLNTTQPFRNTFIHLPSLHNAKVIVEKDGQLVDEMAARYAGIGIYTAKKTFNEPGEYLVSMLFSDSANGFALDKAETSYPLLVTETGNAPAMATDDHGPAMPSMPAPAPMPMGPEPAPAASLEQITYDASTPQSVLMAGRRTFESSCTACHALPTAPRIKAFASDHNMVEYTIGMAQGAGLQQADAERVIRYMLAVRHDTAP